MAFFYVNDNPQPSGEHEVHESGCVSINEANAIIRSLAPNPLADLRLIH